MNASCCSSRSRPIGRVFVDLGYTAGPIKTLGQSAVNGLHRVAQTVQADGAFPGRCFDRKPVVVDFIAKAFQLVEKLIRRDSIIKAVLDGVPQLVPVCELSCFVCPIDAFPFPEEGGVLQHGQAMLPADLIRDLPQTNMVPDMVLEFLPVLERYSVDHDVIVDGIRVQMSGDDHLIHVTPHAPGGLDPDLVCLLR